MNQHRNELTNCVFTGLPLEMFSSGIPDTLCYEVQSEKKHLIYICNNCLSDIVKIPFKDRSVIGAMILNDQLNLQNNVFHLDASERFPANRIVVTDILKNVVSISPQEKLDRLLISLQAKQEYEGIGFEFELRDFGDEIFIRNFILPLAAHFYLDSLKQLSYIELEIIGNAENSTTFNIAITMEGIQRLYELQRSGANSNTCFIAMSFKEDTQIIRQTIKNVLTDLKYDFIIIDEELIDRESTVNDAIIAGLKKSRFCISDFTFQSYGVYFESGFALGLGRKVIYTCRKDWFDKTHFDTNHFPHIVYRDEKELYKMLKDKIEAWIK